MDYSLNNMRNSGEVLPQPIRDRVIIVGIFLSMFAAMAYWFVCDVALFAVGSQTGWIDYTQLLLIDHTSAYQVPFIIGFIIAMSYTHTVARSQKYIFFLCLFVSHALCVGGCATVGAPSDIVVILLYLLSIGYGLMIFLDRRFKGMIGLVVGMLTTITILGLVTTTILISELNSYIFEPRLLIQELQYLLDEITAPLIFAFTPLACWIAPRFFEQWHVYKHLQNPGAPEVLGDPDSSGNL